MIPFLPPPFVQEVPYATAPTPFPGPVETLRSPDGRWLLVHVAAQAPEAHLKQAHQLLLLDLRGGGTSRLLAYGRHADACFSPDGRHLLVTEWTAADAAGIRLYRLEGGPVRASLERWIGPLQKQVKSSSFQVLGWQDAKTFRLQWWGYGGEAEAKSFRRGFEVRLDDGVKEVYPREGEATR
ncbi:MAG TPA: hypothetical protein VJ570_10695 [Holophagaceae bacterium]|nr:hypothetical protein [Holophagaceae bacterium]